jgi:hypothetical protein
VNCSKCQKPAEPAHRVYEATLCDVCLRDWHLEQRRILPEAFLIWLPPSATHGHNVAEKHDHPGEPHKYVWGKQIRRSWRIKNPSTGGRL